MNADHYRDVIQKVYSPQLFKHSLRTADTAVMLAERFGANRDKACLAGLIHDYGKRFNRQELLVKAEEYNFKPDRITRGEARLLHAPVGAVMIAAELKISDQEVLNAVTYHTTGHNRLSKLGKVLYLADFIEEGRSFEGVEEVRKLAEHDLNQALLMEVYITILSVVARGMALHPRSVGFRNSLLKYKKINLG